jgi:hypothetical protein
VKDLVRTTLLEEANALIHGDRAEAYGSALQNAKDWAQMFSAATGLEVRPEHYPVALICTKLVREKHKTKRDNWVDIAGFAGVWGKMDAEKELDREALKNIGPRFSDSPIPGSKIGGRIHD